MVHISLVSPKGNSVRYWPHSGYLGLTPVKVEGVVVTRRNDDMKLLKSRDISVAVRCYESRIGRTGVLNTNVLVEAVQVLWMKADNQEYEDIGDGEYPFRITLPANIEGFSTSTFVEYKCVWRIEAVINHAPLSGIGSRTTQYAVLPLFRYDTASLSNLSSLLEPQSWQETSKPRASVLRYLVNAPRSAIGPMDLVSVPVLLRPMNPNVIVKSIDVTIERRIQIQADTTTPTPTPIPKPRSSSSSLFSTSKPSSYRENHSNSLPVPSSSSSSVSDETATIHSTRPSEYSDTVTLVSPSSCPPPHEARRAIVYPVTATHSDGPFSRTEDGAWSKTLTVEWPDARTNNRWSVGETIQSDLVSIRFFVRVKVVIGLPSGGAETLELRDEEVIVASTNEAERRLAVSKHNEASTRSKSKSPRRSHKRKGEHGQQPPVPASTSLTAAKAELPSVHTSKRRPHTSAGPRDASRSFHRSEETENHVVSRPRSFLRPSSQSSTTTGGGSSGPEVVKSNAFGYVFSPLMPSFPRGSVSPSIRTVSSQESDAPPSVQEWEQELARIEVQSRRSSELLGFSRSKKERSFTHPSHRSLLVTVNGKEF